MFTDAGEAERLGWEFFAHAWLLPEGARWWRELLAQRFADETAQALARRARGERGDVWGEARRLASWIDTLDTDMAWRGESLAYRRAVPAGGGPGRRDHR